MKSFMKKVIMGALALAIVMSGVINNPIATKAGTLSCYIDWDDALSFKLDGVHELTANNVGNALHERSDKINEKINNGHLPG